MVPEHRRVRGATARHAPSAARARLRRAPGCATRRPAGVAGARRPDRRAHDAGAAARGTRARAQATGDRGHRGGAPLSAATWDGDGGNAARAGPFHAEQMARAFRGHVTRNARGRNAGAARCSIRGFRCQRRGRKRDELGRGRPGMWGLSPRPKRLPAPSSTS